MAAWPKREACTDCGAPLLLARNGPKAGRPYRLDLLEVSAMKRDDPDRDRITRGRWRVAVDEAGHARPLAAREKREPGEAIHRRHRCREVTA